MMTGLAQAAAAAPDQGWLLDPELVDPGYAQTIAGNGIQTSFPTPEPPPQTPEWEKGLFEAIGNFFQWATPAAKPLMWIGAALLQAHVLQAADVRVGVIGLDTSHAIAFTEMLNAEKKEADFEGFRVTAAYTYGSLDIVSSTNRYPEYTKKMTALGVEIVGSVAELLQRTDVVLLETNDGRRHLELAVDLFKWG
jgi:hypothetical protein